MARGTIHPSLTVKGQKAQSIVSSSSSPLPTTRTIIDDDEHDYNNTSLLYRGVFATKDIPKGDLLISLPSKLVISEERLPHSYHRNNFRNDDDNDDEESSNVKREKLNATPWLRCISAFLSSINSTKSLHSHECHYAPYPNSLV